MPEKVKTAVGPQFWPAPAKLNLMLRITGRRTDGYHNLQTVFQLIDFGDEIAIEPIESGKIVSLTSIPGVSRDADLTLRAAQRLKDVSGTPMGAAISTKKILPLGAGLGAGSSCAATVLCVLNKLWRTGLNLDELSAVGLALGADVPVFVRGVSAWAEGIGEVLTPLELPDRWYLVLLPGVYVSTAEVFADPALTRNSSAITIRAFLAGLIDGAVENSCRASVVLRYPQIGEALNWLEANSAAQFVGMTGTGSSLFAAFTDRGTAREVLENIPAPWSGFVARGVNKSPLHRVASFT
jgi:4-diphosphocytidyl-2-C-methyl-D-erythritol kinase